MVGVDVCGDKMWFLGARMGIGEGRSWESGGMVMVYVLVDQLSSPRSLRVLNQASEWA